MSIHRNPYLVPGAIIVAGGLVASAIIWSGAFKQAAEITLPGTPAINVDAIRPVTSGEHFLGDVKTAEVVVLEYSDLECPYCKAFHEEMRTVMADESLKGKVAWVFRHFPIDSNHTKARNEAEASECAAELGGNTAFWNYIHRLFEISPTNDGLDPAQLPEIAAYIGLDKTAFSACLAENKYQEKIQQDYENAVETGGRGTPWNMAIAKDGNVTPIGGYVSAAQIKATVQKLLK